jgi:hypothetical protein
MKQSISNILDKIHKYFLFLLINTVYYFRKFDLAAPWEQFPNFREQLPAAEEVDIEKKE